MSTQRTRQTLLAGALVTALLAVGVAGWLLLAPTPEPPAGDGTGVATGDATGNTPSQPQSSAQPGPLLQGPARWQIDYDFALERVEAPIALAVGGELTLGAPVEGPGGRWVAARLAPSAVELSAGAKAALGALNKGALDAAWAIRLSEEGTVAEVRFEPALPFPAKAVLAELAFGLQLREGGAPGTEAGLNGAVEARYRREGEAVVREVSTQSIGERTTTTTRFSGPKLSRVQLQRRGSATTGGVRVAGFVPVRLDIRVARREGAPPRPPRLVLASLRPFDARAPRRMAKSRPAAPVSEQLRLLREQTSGVRTQARMAARNALTYAIREQKGAVTEVARALRARELPPRAEVIAVAAVAGARTPEAQSALLDLAGDTEVAQDLRMKVLQASSLMSGPNPAFVGGLLELALSRHDPAYAAAAATTAGASARYLAETHPKAASEAVAALVKRAATLVVADPDENAGPKRPTARVEPERLPPVGVRLAWIAGLGNTGDPAALPTLLAALKDKNEAVRGGAALALRFQAPEVCIATMVKLMATDHSVHVRENVVDAARFMGPAVTQQLVEKALLLDESPFVRLAAAYTLSVWAHDAPGLRKVLLVALTREKDARVIDALQHFVDKGRIQGKPATSVVSPGAP